MKVEDRYRGRCEITAEHSPSAAVDDAPIWFYIRAGMFSGGIHLTLAEARLLAAELTAAVKACEPQKELS